MAVHPDFAGLRLIKTHQQMYDGGFSGTAFSYQRHFLAGFNAEVNLFQDLRLRAGWIGKGNRLKFNLSLGPLQGNFSSG